MVDNQQPFHRWEHLKPTNQQLCYNPKKENNNLIACVTGAGVMSWRCSILLQLKHIRLQAVPLLVSGSERKEERRRREVFTFVRPVSARPDFPLTTTTKRGTACGLKTHLLLITYSEDDATVDTQQSFWLIFDIFFTTFWQLSDGFRLTWPIKIQEVLEAES